MDANLQEPKGGSSSGRAWPENVKKVHLIAVCGTGMGALAGMLKELGLAVTGSDHHVYPPMDAFLAAKGIPIDRGYAPEHLDHGPDLVVVGNAVSRDNPEVGEVLRRQIPFCSLPEALNRFLVRGKTPLMVAGTHGKTTTSSILAWVLEAVGLDPSFFIGGILENFGSNHRVGKGPHIVIEGDEYDTAFFDKQPKFLHFMPSRTILTSVEFDHADIYRDLEDVKEAFGRMLERLPRESLLVHHAQDPNIRRLLERCTCRTEGYGDCKTALWRLGEVSIAPPWTFFEVLKNGTAYHRFRTALMGRHNLENLLAAVAVADDLGVPVAETAAALPAFKGVKRRQQVRGVKRGVTVMDDFAHHPTAVRETLKAVRPYYRDARLIAVFEPRTNSSRRKVFQTIYPESFGAADIVCVREPTLLEKIPPAERFSSEQLVEDLKERGQEAHFFPDTDSIIDFLVGASVSGDLVVIMSNGSFDNIHERLLEAL